MKYKKTTFPNGLRLITVPISSLESATVTIWVGVGSRYEIDKKAGLSHFLEHMVFKGSKKRPTAKEIAEAIDSFGGEFNASTSKEWTNFYIKAPTKRLDTAVDVLSDMVLNPFLRSEDIEREKGVIIEEIAMYEDTPIAKIGDIFESVIYKGNTLARDIAGFPKTVRAIKRADFVNYRKAHYSSKNIVVTVSGGFNESKIIKLMKNQFASLKPAKVQTYGKFEEKQKSPRVHLKYKDNEQAHFILGFLGEKRGTEDRFVEAVLSTVLGGGMSSRMFTEVREKRGLAYAVRSSSDKSQDTGYMATYVGADTKRVDDAVKVVLDEYMKLIDGRDKITDKELTKAKEYLKGHMALSLEDTTDINAFFGVKELLDKKIETPEEVFAQIDKVSIDDIERVAKKFYKRERLNFAIIGPFKDRGRFESILK